MFQLTIHNIVQFASLMIYIILISLILYSKRAKLKRLFILFLVAAAGMSLTSLLMNLRLPYEHLTFWKTLMPLFSAWSVVAYAHFIAASYQRDTTKISRMGYVWLAIVSILVVGGTLTQGMAFLNSEVVTIYYGQFINALAYINAFIILMVGIFLIKILQDTSNPEERNKTFYLLAGLGIMVTASIMNVVFQNTNYSFAHIGYSVNAVLITYTLIKHRLIDIQIIMKKWMVYTGVTVCITLAYLGLLLGLSNILRLLPAQYGIPATIVMVVLFAYLFNWAKSALDRGADRLFYGKRYVHRLTLLNFASRMSNFINIKEIANALTGPLARAIRVRQVGLLLPIRNRYATKYLVKLNDEDQVEPLTLQKNSPLIKWMASEGKLVLRENIEHDPQFHELSEEDRRALKASRVEVLCPITTKHQLLGILMLTEKYPKGHYSRDDIDLIANLAQESAVAMENAQIYASAKDKADTDELTGLRNHRYFQESLNDVIENSALSGNDFALLFIDLDLFKTYNDIYGHIMGDELLKDFGKLIKRTIRDTDIGARYGGDEFSCILRQTDISGAQKVAERIRQKFEAQMKQKGAVVTCSIGIACWRIDGVMREKIVEAADQALYHAKRAGGNRVSLASKLNADEKVKTEVVGKADTNKAIESIVYALAATVDTRDHYTYGHSKAVCRYSIELAEAAGYSPEEIQIIRSAALLHDIGKLNLPDSILTKREPLTDTEWDMIKHHPELGARILKYIVGLRGCVDAVLFHHERYDGKGYPRGLSGEDIPRDARIMAIADSYDAMTSERGYKKRAFTEEEALRELKACAGTQFDPELVDLFINIREKSVTPEINLDNILQNDASKTKKK
jgi:diguanylate cyclase (GGDEF)-like protein/putative nucleotidyltransferase with HDIG domain